MNAQGITAAGNWIVDRVLTVDHLPSRGMLASISAEERSTGGAPANVLADLARLDTGLPLAGIGIVGDDTDGQFIQDTFRDLPVNMTHLAVTREAPTSYTNVMNEEGSGDRMFFHHRGANALFSPKHVPVTELSCRIFHLGYLLLLDGMDAPDPDYGTQAARLLADVQQAGIRTSLDVVSEDSDRFQTLVPHALKHVDYLILNEIEAGRTTGKEVRRPDGSLDKAALSAALDDLSQLGQSQLVAIHMPEGAILKPNKGEPRAIGSLQIPDGFIVGNVGAGDAFCAGMLYGLHEDWDFEKCANLGACCAAASLSRTNATDGLMSLEDVLALGETFGQKPPPLAI